MVHEGKRCEVYDLAVRVWRLSWEHWFAWRRKLNPAVSQHWQPPPKESLKVNIDVAIREEFAVVAALIQDHKGQLRGFKTARISAVEPLVGEAMAMKMGVELASHLGYQNIILEGDSEIVISALIIFLRLLIGGFIQL